MLFVANGFAVGSFVGRIPPLKDALDLTEAGLGAVLFGPPLGTIAAVVAVGAVIGRIGAGRAILGGIAVGAVGLATVPLAARSVTAFPGLTVLGAGLGAMDLGMNARGVVVEERYGRSVMVAFHGAWSVGTLVGGAIAGLTIAAGWSTGLHLWLAAGLVVVLALVGAALSSDAEAARDPHAETRIALPDRALLPIALIAVVSALGEGAAGDWAGVHLYETLGTSTAVAASGYVVFSLTMAVTRLLGDRAVRAFGPRRVASSSGLIARPATSSPSCPPRSPPRCLASGSSVSASGRSSPSPSPPRGAARADAASRPSPRSDTGGRSWGHPSSASWPRPPRCRSRSAASASRQRSPWSRDVRWP